MSMLEVKLWSQVNLRVSEDLNVGDFQCRSNSLARLCSQGKTLEGPCELLTIVLVL